MILNTETVTTYGAGYFVTTKYPASFPVILNFWWMYSLCRHTDLIFRVWYYVLESKSIITPDVGTELTIKYLYNPNFTG